MIKQEVKENGLIADLFTDGASNQKKAIIAIGGSEGGKSWSRIKRPIELLVQQGYAVLSLAYFKAPGLPDSLQKIPLEYFEKAFNWLSEQNGIVPNQFAILGGSKGAEAALVLGSLFPQVKAIIAFSPSSVVWQGIPDKRFELGRDVKSSWTYRGELLPFLPYSGPINKIDLVLMQLNKMHSNALKDTKKSKNAAIQVEYIQGPILLISGKRDRMWPSNKMSSMLMNRLKAKGFDFAYEHISFNTGHNGIIINKDCWRRVFSFLDENFA